MVREFLNGIITFLIILQISFSIQDSNSKEISIAILKDYITLTCALKNKKIIGETINIGNNFEISIREILNILKEDYNFKFRIKIDKKRIRPKKK